LPDESCRNCGGALIENAKCFQCMKSTRMICSVCDYSTSEQFHSICTSNPQNHSKSVPKIESGNYSKIVVMA